MGLTTICNPPASRQPTSPRKGACPLPARESPAMPTTAARLAHPATPSYTPATPANPHTGGLLCRASGVEGALPRAGRVSSSRLSRHASPPVVAQPSRPFTRQPTSPPRRLSTSYPQGTYPQVMHNVSRIVIHNPPASPAWPAANLSTPHPAAPHKLSTPHPQVVRRTYPHFQRPPMRMRIIHVRSFFCEACIISFFFLRG